MFFLMEDIISIVNSEEFQSYKDRIIEYNISVLNPFILIFINFVNDLEQHGRNGVIGELRMYAFADVLITYINDKIDDIINIYHNFFTAKRNYLELITENIGLDDGLEMTRFYNNGTTIHVYMDVDPLLVDMEDEEEENEEEDLILIIEKEVETRYFRERN